MFNPVFSTYYVFIYPLVIKKTWFAGKSLTVSIFPARHLHLVREFHLPCLITRWYFLFIYPIRSHVNLIAYIELDHHKSAWTHHKYPIQIPIQLPFWLLKVIHIPMVFSILPSKNMVFSILPSKDMVFSIWPWQICSSSPWNQATLR